MKIKISGDRFVNENGDQILFNGVNFVCKDPGQGYLFPEPERVFRRFREQGFNLIRLGIFWDGVEPQPGVYDQDYLQRVRDVIELARQNGLYVIHHKNFSSPMNDEDPAGSIDPGENEQIGPMEDFASPFTSSSRASHTGCFV